MRSAAAGHLFKICFQRKGNFFLKKRSVLIKKTNIQGETKVADIKSFDFGILVKMPVGIYLLSISIE